jgi:hypothetical protein
MSIGDVNFPGTRDGCTTKSRVADITICYVLQGQATDFSSERELIHHPGKIVLENQYSRLMFVVFAYLWKNDL